MFSHRMAAAALEASIKTNSGYSGWPGAQAFQMDTVIEFVPGITWSSWLMFKSAQVVQVDTVI